MTTPRLDALDIHDVYQPVTDWAFASQFRMLTCKVTDGTGDPRPGGLDYFHRFRQAGTPLRGIYHWLRSTSAMSAQVARLAEAVDRLGGLQPGEFIQLDWEKTPGIPNVSVAQVVEWLRLVDERWPDRTIVYASDWVPGFAEWRARDPRRPLWYANYNTGDKPTGGWAECERWAATVWQWTSSAQVPGIATRCDGNHVFDWPTLERIAHTSPAPAPTPITPQEDDGMDVDYNGMILNISGSVVRRVVSGEFAVAPRKVTKAGLTAELPQLRTSGPSPFDGTVAGYADADLDKLWKARPSVLAATGTAPTSGTITGTFKLG